MKPNAPKEHRPHPSYTAELIAATGLSINEVAKRLDITPRSLQIYRRPMGRMPYLVQFALECLAKK